MKKGMLKTLIASIFGTAAAGGTGFVAIERYLHVENTAEEAFEIAVDNRLERLYYLRASLQAACMKGCDDATKRSLADLERQIKALERKLKKKS